MAQVVLSTHSPHLVADCGFSPVRYLRRRGAEAVLKDLSQLQPLRGGDASESAAALAFLRRYVKLTHCDLLFADKAVVVEGQVEKLLLPAMIEAIAKMTGFEGFSSQYISVLEVGGAYAHKIDPFLRFIGIPTLVIADIDSATEERRQCPVYEGKITTNQVLRYWMPNKNTIEELLAAADSEKVTGDIRIAYQIPEAGRCGRSFEEAFVYANVLWLRDNASAFSGSNQAELTRRDDLVSAAYGFGLKVSKVDFALDLMTTEGWRPPAYIEEGLKWLAARERSGR